MTYRPPCTYLKDLDPIVTIVSTQETEVVLKIVFVLSKSPHLHRAFFVTICNQNFRAVRIVRPRHFASPKFCEVSKSF